MPTDTGPHPSGELRRRPAALALAGVAAEVIGGAWLVGPVLGYELRRLARRGPTVFLARGVYLGLLLLLLVVLYESEVKYNLPQGPGAYLHLFRARLAFLGAQFTEILLLAQTTALVLLTPAFAAGAIADERERRTLDFLLVSDLSSREIVLGKLLARLAPPALLLLAGLPVLAIVQVLGGVDPPVILGGFAIDGLLLASLGSVSVLYSVSVRKPWSAALCTYLTVGGYFLLLACFHNPLSRVPGSLPASPTLARILGAGNPFSAIFRILGTEYYRSPRAGVLVQVLGDALLFHGSVVVACTALAAQTLRPRVAKVVAPGGRPETAPEQLAPCPGVGNRPVLWKELNVEFGHRSQVWWSFLVFVAACWLLLVAAVGVCVAVAEHTAMPWERGKLDAWFLVAGQAVAFLAFVAVAVRAAGAWSRERERRTLDDLLVSDLTNAELTLGKWWGSIWSLRGVWVYLGAVLCLSVMCGRMKPWPAVLLGIGWMVYAAFAASVGEWCSLRCRSTWRATALTLGLLLAFTAGHWVLYWGLKAFFDRDDEFVWLLKDFHLYGLTPPITLDRLGSSPGLLWLLDWYDLVPAQPSPFGPFPRPELEIRFALIGLCLYGLMAAELRARTTARFAHLTGRMPVALPRALPHPPPRPLS
jgi:ABC-type transport system involved in multi-copper enzyme maturation permease subunit